MKCGIRESLPQGKLAGADVGVEFVFAMAYSLEGAEQAAVRFAKGSGFEAASGDGSVDVGIVGGIADANDQLARVKLNVFVSGDAAELQLSGGHANKQARGTRHLNGDLNVVLGAAGNTQLCGLVKAFKADFDLPGFVRILGSNANGDLVLLSPDEAEVA